jgi:tetratricopeptide (TPR) repeat protein
LSRYDRRLEGPAPADPETRRQLEALGYVGGASTTDDDVLPDPKTRVDTMAEIKRAYRLYADGDFESAVAALQQIIEENPAMEDAWEYLALAKLGLGRPAEAAATYEAALKQIPNSKRLALRAALLLDRIGRLDEAFVYANIAIPYNPPAAHLLLAQIAFRRGDLEGSEMEAREAMSSGDRQSGPWLVLADIFTARGEPHEAIDLLIQALDEGITDVSVRAKLAITYVWIGEFDQAEETLRGFENTDDLSLLLAFGRLALSREQWNEARSWFDRARLVDPTNATVKLNLGFIAMAEGRLADARRNLEEGVAEYPRSFEGWNTLGIVCARQRDAKGAIVAWERAHELDPGFLGLTYNLGLAYAQDGQVERAIGYFEEFAADAEQGPQREQALAMVERLRLRASQSRQP